MDEIWERAVESALDGQTEVASVRTLTLDGAVKCVHGRLPPPSLFEKFQHLQHLSIANIGVSSLEQFPHLQNLQKLILSDNRIAGGLEFLVEAGLESLRDLDLSNNRIQDIDDLRPLAELRLVSLDLYECPVTRMKDYRSRVFGLIKSLKYLDKMDADENERPESDDEDDDEEEEEEDDEEDDPGSGEIDGEDRPFRVNSNGHSVGNDGVVDVDEDEESDADVEETEISRGVNGVSRAQGNGFHVAPVNGEEYEDDDDDEENDLVEEIDEEEGEDEDVVEVHEIEDSDDEEDGVEDEENGVEYEDDDDDDDDDDDNEDEEEVDNDEGDLAEPGSTGRLTSTEGEIDGHEHGEEDGDEDDDGETGEEEVGADDGDFDEEDAEDEEEDLGTGYLVQPVGQVEGDAVGSDMDPGDEDDDPDLEEEMEDEEDEEGDGVDVPPPPPSPSSNKRKRDGDGDDSDGDDGGEDDDTVEHFRSAKRP